MVSSNYSTIAIGGSAGSMEGLLKLFSSLPKELRLPIVIVNHLHPEDNGGLVAFFKQQTHHPVQEAADKAPVLPGYIYFPAADYHLLVEANKTFSLSIDPKVNYSRPSIDVFFESAAHVWEEKLVAIILSGASSDGAEGIRTIHRFGGFTIAQDPAEAAYSIMPQAAIDTGRIDRILAINDICNFFQRISAETIRTGHTR